MKRLFVLLFGIFIVGISQNYGYGENWPGWRGDGSGVSNEKNLPVKWGVDKDILWKTRIEDNGISSPIV